MPIFAPDQLAHWAAGRWTRQPGAALGAFSFDTRKLRSGDVFVALKTEKRDGHDYLADAQSAGAAAALVANADPRLILPQLVVRDPLEALQTIAHEHRRTFGRPIIGISGSAGKTSTKDLLALLLGGASCGVVATEGNLNNHLGVPLTLLRLDPGQHSCAVIEAGISAPGEMAPLARMIEPDVAILTLVAPAHTEELGGLAGVAREKSVLAAMLRPNGLAIFPQSVAEFAAFRELKVQTLVVSRAEAASGVDRANRATFTVSHQEGRSHLSVVRGGARRDFVLRRVSDGMAQNAALAIAAARHLGVADDLIQSRLSAWQPAKMRGEIRELDGRLLYLDCYNANPASMADALAAFESVAPAEEPRLFVLGCMEELGVDAAAHHHALGRSLRLRENDQLFVIGSHAHDVCAGVLDQGDFTRQMQIVSTLEPVSAFLADWRGAIFVKGSRRYQLEKILEVQASLPLC